MRCRFHVLHFTVNAMGKTEFTRREIEEIIEILGIDKVEALEGIFFDEKVS